jgi:uncharacterized protein YdiU (UPF0061 family)
MLIYSSGSSSACMLIVRRVRRDIQLKGAGPTPYSRRGDGRAALGPVLREYIVSEAMAALGIPIAGETIDYGPCAFMDLYHPRTVYSSIDKMGRYAYGNQPAIAQWNLVRLAETLLPLLAEGNDTAVKEAQEAIGEFAKAFEMAYAAGLSRKLGLLQPRPDDLSLAQDLFDRMALNGADFTLVFRRLCDAAAGPEGDTGVRSLFADPGAFDDWAVRWRHRLAEEGGEPTERHSAMRAANPAFIPRNHLVEEAIMSRREISRYGAGEKSRFACRRRPVRK